MVCRHLLARAAGKIKSRSFIYNLSCQLSAQWALLFHYPENRGAFEATDSGVVYDQLMGAAKPSL
jgi:hypothetical protein